MRRSLVTIRPPDTNDIIIQEPNVFLGEGGVVLTSSKDVAEAFERQHQHVLRDIDALRSHRPDLDDVYFQEVRTPHPTVPGRETRSFNMTRDGFTLLAMGFTGEKALGFKMAYLWLLEERSKVGPSGIA